MKDWGEREAELALTVVVPVYREQQRLVRSLEALAAFVAATDDARVDVILVDDGSPDNTTDLINTFLEDRDDPRLRLIRYARNRGKGFAVKTGVLAATGDVVLMSDADLSTPLEDWRILYQAVRRGADVVCGSRAVSGAHIGKPPPWYRRRLSRLFNLLVRLAGVRGILDTQCGFKLFRAAPARDIFSRLRTERFAFDVEVLAWAVRLGYRVAEVPVNWDYSGHSTVRLFSSGGRMLWDLLVLALKNVCVSRR